MSAPGGGTNDERKHDIDEDSPVNDVRVPNVFDRVKEEIEAVSLAVHEKRSSGTDCARKDIDEDSSLSDVKAPNVLERAKEEIEAISHAIRAKETSEMHDTHKDIDETMLSSDVKAPNMFERAREEIEAIVQTIHQKKECQPHSKETHGMRKDIDESTPVDEVKAPNVFERAKEEIDALVQTIHQPKKDAPSTETRDQSVQPATVSDSRNSSSGKNKASDLIKKAKADIKEMMLVKLSPRHHKKSHDKNDQIDMDTPLSEVKGPNLFVRAKEEIDALVEAIHQKKEAKKEDRTAAQDNTGPGISGQ